MKTKKILKLFYLITALLLLLTFAFASAATSTNQSIQPRYISVVQFWGDLSINSAGRADCSADVTLRNTTDEVVLIMSLRRSEDGVTWSSEETWSASGNWGASMYESIYVASGYYYKVNVSATVYNENGHYIETATTSSNTINYGAD